MKKIISFSILYFIGFFAMSQSTLITPLVTKNTAPAPLYEFLQNGVVKGQVGVDLLGESNDDVFLQTGLFNSTGIIRLRNSGGTRFQIRPDGKIGVGDFSMPILARFNTTPINNVSPTNAVFGTNGNGISLQQDYPTIGFNQYRDDANVQRYIGNGFAGGNFLYPLNGYFYWRSIANGSAGASTAAETPLMTLSNTGQIGLNTIGDPHGWIHLPPTLENKKIILYENPANNDQHQFYGFGIQSGQMNYHVDFPTASHVFYAATSTTNSKEIMRIKGDGSFSAGEGNSVNAIGGMALGTGNTITSTALYSNAFGIFNEVSGQISTAIGQNNDVRADRTLVFGQNLTIDAAADGSVILFDNSGPQVGAIGIQNRFRARFNEGYLLYTNAAQTTGVLMNNGANSWSSISDRNKKENFEAVDAENLLRKASKIPSSTWNYKGQDAKIFRHYGPMAQDFYAAFGKDKYGVIGNDTTIASADFNGVNFVLIQALEKRTRDLYSENEKLKSQITDFQALAAKLERIEAMLSDKEKVRVSDK